MDMMKRWKKTVLTAAALTIVLSGCGGAGTISSSNNPAKQEETKPFELSFYQSSSGMDEAKFMELYGNAIHSKFPQVIIKFYPNQKGTNINELITAGQNVDIIFDSIGLIYGSLIQTGLQQDISDLIAKNKMDLSRFEPVTIDLMRQIAKGGIYGLPVGMTSAALFYNKDIFDKQGVPYPKDGMTWDETFELAKKLTFTDGGTAYRGMTMSFNHLSLTNSFSLDFVDLASHKATLANDKWALFIRNFERFFAISGNELDAQTAPLAKQQAFFDKERVSAMWGMLSSYKPADTTFTNWDLVSLPTFKEASGIGPQAYPSYFSITNSSKHREEAFKVLEFLVSDEFQMNASKNGSQTALRNAAIRKAFSENLGIYKDKNIGALYPKIFAKSTNLTEYNSTAWNELIKAFTAVTVNKTDINTALRNAEEAANKTIAQLKQK
jgi:multiple sugar transport system substrate-binding protein